MGAGHRLETKLENALTNCKSTPVPLDYLIDDYKLINKLHGFGLLDTSDLWIPIILDQFFGDHNRIELLHYLLRSIELRICPFKTPEYTLDYSVHLESTGDYPSMDLGNDLLLNYRIIIKTEIIVRDIKIYLSVVCHSRIMEMDSTDIEYDSLLKEIRAGVMHLDYRTSPKSIEWQEIIKVEKYPLLLNLLKVLDTKSKGYSGVEKAKDIFIRRNGLISGKIETLEQIANSKNLSRERVRQIEEKANKIFLYRIRRNHFLSSSSNIIKDQIRANLLCANRVLEGKEVIDFINGYIDFIDYQPSLATAFLCNNAKFYVQRSQDENDTWFLALTENDYGNFCKTYLMITGTDLNSSQSRTTFNYELFDQVRLVFRYLNYDGIELIREIAKSIIGASKVMRWDDFITGLINSHYKINEKLLAIISPDELGSESICVNSNSLLCKIAGVSIVPFAEYENIVLGKWVISGLTEKTQQIVRAILYAATNQVNDTPESNHFIELRQGISLSEIAGYLRNRIGINITEHTIEAICRRYPNVFIITGARHWGLIGAGSALSTSKEKKTISDVSIIDYITQILINSPGGIGFSELVREVRGKIPSASEQTIRVYLNNIHKERFETIRHETYKLSDRYTEYLEKRHE